MDKDAKWFICKECYRAYTTKKEFKKHLVTYHDHEVKKVKTRKNRHGEKSEKKKEKKSKKGLSKKLNPDGSDEDGLFHCLTCKKCFGMKAALDVHKKKHKNQKKKLKESLNILQNESSNSTSQET